MEHIVRKNNHEHNRIDRINYAMSFYLSLYFYGHITETSLSSEIILSSNYDSNF